MAKDLIPKQLGLKLFGDKFEMLPNGIIIHGQPSEAEYDEAFRRLSIIESATSWWYGDLANDRDKHYGSLKEMAERLELDYSNLRKCASVASQYRVLLRSNTLSFLHHQIAAPLEDRLDWLKQAERYGWSVRELRLEILKANIEPYTFNGSKPLIAKADYLDWLPSQPECDLLLTDPPYSTDIEDINKFVNTWMPMALGKIKPTGRGFIFIGPYPWELKAYLLALGDKINDCQIMAWEYKNTIGPAPINDYKNNLQIIIHYKGEEVRKLNAPILNERNTVQEFSMPGAKSNPYHHPWEKPMELAERLIRHTTRKNDLVLDPFSGSGTFLIAAAKLGRLAHGCDISQEMIDVAKIQGCEVDE